MDDKFKKGQLSEMENEYVFLKDCAETTQYSNVLKLTVKSTGETQKYSKSEVSVGRAPSMDYHIDNNYVARQQATFIYEREMWFLRDNNSTNGTYINGKRLEPGKKYQLAPNDEICFAKQETVVFDMQEKNEQAKGNPEAKTLVFLEAGMAAFAKSGYKDESSLKLIIAALTEAPLYFPMEIDMSAMFGDLDPTKLKAGDTIQPKKDVRMRILTLCPEGGIEHVAMFTSNDEANKGPSASIVRMYPYDYLPKLIDMDMPVIINPFSDSRFLLSKEIMVDILWPAVQRKNAELSEKTETDEKESPIDRKDQNETAQKKKGFFGKLFGEKSSKPKVNETVQKIYDGMDKDNRDKVFYGGVSSAENILISLTQNVFGNDSVNDININLCFQIYLQTWIRSRGGLNPAFSTPAYIKEALCKRFSTIDANIVLKCVDDSLNEIYSHEPDLKAKADAVEAIQKSVQDNSKKNAEIENAYLDDPEYGLIPAKPVFVNGFGNDKEYLSHLHAEDGTKLSFTRVGSSEVEGIAGPVDLYRLLKPDGTDYMRIFICNYGTSTKKIAPKGTKYLD